MEKILKYMSKNKIKIILLCIIAIIATIAFFGCRNSKTEEIVSTAAKWESKASQTTVPEGFTGIYSAEDLANINNNLSGKYILMSDIDMTGKTHTIIGQSSSFSGTLDGNFHTISNLTIESSEQYVGLFGYISSGTVINMTLENVNITGTSRSGTQYIGGLAGRSIRSTIEGVQVKGSNIKDTGASYIYIGGLVGYVELGKIKNSSADTNIVGGIGTSYIGGLVGSVNVPSNANIIEQSYSKGKITIGSGLSYVGGLVGTVSNAKNTSPNVIVNAYSTVNIDGENNNTSTCIGGLIGEINSYLATYKISMYNTYAIGNIDVNTTGTKGGLVGKCNWANVYSSYWSSETSRINTSACGVNRMIQEMLDKTSYSWDFDTIWDISENKGSLPYLRGMEKPSEVLEENLSYKKYEGKGTEEEPYIIDSIEKFQKIDSFSSATYFKLSCDLDASGEEDFIPIGTQKMPFSGVLDGNNHKISNLTIKSSEQYVGLFGYINSGTVKNMTLENVNITGTSSSETQYIGGLAGFCYRTVIEGVQVKRSNTKDTGTSYIYIGGLVGYVQLGEIRNSFADTNIVGGMGTSYIGGLVGSVNAASNANIIEQSYSKGKITIGSGLSCVGGLVGSVSNAQNTSPNVIVNAYSTVNIDGENNNASTGIGGLIGYINSYLATYKISIDRTYAVGEINVTTTGSKGGLIGKYNWANIYSSYYQDESVETTNVGGEKRTIVEMMYKANYTSWDFDKIWAIEENGRSLPYLKDLERPAEVLKENYESDIKYDGSGTKEDPFIIDTIEKLQNINYNILLRKSYSIIKCDLDASGIEKFIPIGTNSKIFKGTIDGNGHKISNLNIESSDNCIGLFRKNSGFIQNLTLENVNINSTYDGETAYIGGIAGYNGGNISNVKVSGNIDNSGEVIDLYMGQVAGYNNGSIGRGHSNGTIQNSGNVTNAYIGGIAGFNNNVIKLSNNSGKIITNNIDNLKIGGIAGTSNKSIIFSYSKGIMQINATNVAIGGIAGENSGRIATTYAVDTIEKNANNIDLGGIAGKNTGTVEDSYWNIDGIEEQEGNGMLKTLEQLKQKDTYENWNFEKIWSIKENEATPTLEAEKYYYDDNYWEWHTRTTTDDQAYNGKHIVIDDSIKFYGYGDISYKDFLYKDYSYAGEKTFSFILDETKASYHTLDGAGFIFNTKQENGELSGYILLVKQNTICLYRIDDINISKFETTPGKINENTMSVENYAGKPIASVNKKSSTVHKFIIKTTPTKITVVDNDEEVLKVDLDYSKHVGESFGLISSYVQHDCSILTKIEFSEFNLEINNYTIPVLKVDQNNNPLQGAEFKVKNAEGQVVRQGTTDAQGIFNIEGLQEGIYTLEETKAPSKYALQSKVYTFKMTSDGKAVDVDTGEELSFKIVNEPLKFEIKDYITNTEIGIPGSKIKLYDEKGNAISDTSGNPIIGTTDENGKVIFTGIEAGTYTYEQIEVPPGYKINTTINKVIIANDGTVTYIEGENGNGKDGIIYNDKIKAEHIIITKYRKDTTIGLSGAVIGLYNDKQEKMLDSDGNHIQLTTNEQGKIDFTDLVAGTYYYKEETAPEGYVLNSTMYKFTVDNEGKVTFENDTKGIIYNDRVMSVAGATKIKKYKTGTTLGLPGAIIELYDNSGNPLLDSEGHKIQLTTNENGEVSIPSLEYGTYQYKEIQAPAGYISNDTMYKFTVNGDGTVSFIENAEGVNGNGIIYNDRVKADHIYITKYKAGTTTPVAGAVIGLYNDKGEKIVNSEGNHIQLTTNEKGEIDFTNLEVGTYQYKELQAPAGYVLNTSMYKFTVDNNGDVTFENDTNGVIYNERVKAEHTYITKYKTGTTLPIAGAVIGLFDKDGNVIYDANGEKVELTTGENGKIDFAGLEPGIYQYQEKIAPAGYVLNTGMYKFIVNEDTTVTYIDGENGNGTNGVIYNDRVKSDHIYITKYKTGTTIGIPGAVIGLFDSNGEAIRGEDDQPIELTTDENGKIDFGNLEVGIYQYKEMEAPAGYILNDTMYKFTVNDNGSVTFENDTNGVIYNDTVMSGEGTAKIRKYKTGTTVPVSGATIGLFDNEGNALRDSEGNEIRLTTNEQGEISIPSLEVGTYQYKELQAPAGYILNDTMYKFKVNNDGTITFIENENADATGGKGKDGIIYDSIVKAPHTIITKYRTGTEIPVPGAVIGLFYDDGNAVITADGEQVKLTTNEQGKIDFTDLEPGTYKYQELQAPSGYVLDDTIYKFKVNNDGTVTFPENESTEGTNGTGKDGIIYNDIIKAESVVIIKYETGTTNPLAGAVIGLFDEQGNPIYEEINDSGETDIHKEQIKLTTDENGQVDFTNLRPGTYQYQELQAPEGYVLKNAMCKFIVNEDGTVTFVEGENGLGRDGIIYNDRVTAGQVIITKYKTGTQVPVPGAVIGLFDSEGTEILGLDGEQVQLITGKNGQVAFKDLEAGKIYQYKEIQEPVGYVRNDTMYKFKVNNDGTVTFIENESADATGGKGKDGIIYNDRVKAEHITITKHQLGTTNPVPGAVIGLFDEQGNPIYEKVSEEEINDSGETDIPKEQIKLTTDENGQIDFTNLEVGTYQYKELEAPTGYILNDTMYKFTVNPNGTVTFENDTEGIIYNEKIRIEDAVITKYKTGTTSPVAGAVIGLFDEDGEIVLDNEGNQVQLTTGSNGQIRFTNLEIGKIYQYKEIQEPVGYVRNDTMYKFKVNNDGTITFIENESQDATGGKGKDGIIYNDRVKIEHIIITKYKTGTTIPVPGAVIGLFDADGNEIKDENENPIQLTTGENGQVDFTNLEPGTYKYQELQEPEGYVLNSTMYEFRINDDKTITFVESGDTDGNGRDGIIYNEEIEKGTIIITKYKTGTTIPVSGAVIGLFDADGKEIKDENENPIQLTTGENGQVKFTNLEEGTYQYKEIQAPEGYIPNETMYKFTVDENGIITFIENANGIKGNGIIYNDKVKIEHIIITKHETGTTTPVPGAVIGLFSENGKEIKDENEQPIRLTTDQNGRIDFTNLEVGTYQYKELQAPEGYVLNDTMYKFIVNADKTVTFIKNENGNGAYGIIYNDRVTSDPIVIIKYRTGTQMPVAGAVIGLFYIDEKPILGDDGNPVKLTTNEEGKIAFTLRPGTYKYKELEAPEGYILNDTMYKFTVGNDGKVTFESGNIIYNDKIKTGEATIIKYETGTTTPISGAVIGLFDKDGNAMKDNKENEIKLSTNNKGQVTFKDLPEGEYQYKEIQAPQGYKLNNEMYKFVVDKEGKVTFKDNTQGIIYNDKEKDKPGNTTPPDNTTPPNNTTPLNNTTPPDNTTPSENNIKPSENVTPNKDTNSSTNTKKNVITSKKKNGIVESIKQGILPKTGTGRLILVILGTLISSAGYYAIKYKRTK